MFNLMITRESLNLEFKNDFLINTLEFVLKSNIPEKCKTILANHIEELKGPFRVTDNLKQRNV